MMRAIVVAFGFILGIAFAYGAYAATDQPNPSWGWRLCGIGGWVIMFVFVGGSTLLLLNTINQH